MNPETPDCSLTSTAKARIPLGMFATSPGGDPLGPSFFSTIGSPSSMVVLTHRSSTSLNDENAPTGTADLAIRDRLDHVGLEDFFLLEVARGDEDVLRLFLGAAGLLIRRRVTSMAPRPRTTASTSIIIDLPFICCISLSARSGPCGFRQSLSGRRLTCHRGAPAQKNSPIQPK